MNTANKLPNTRNMLFVSHANPVGFPRKNGHRIYVIHYLVCLIFEVKRALII